MEIECWVLPGLWKNSSSSFSSSTFSLLYFSSEKGGGEKGRREGGGPHKISPRVNSFSMLDVFVISRNSGNGARKLREWPSLHPSQDLSMARNTHFSWHGSSGLGREGGPLLKLGSALLSSREAKAKDQAQMLSSPVSQWQLLQWPGLLACLGPPSDSV